MSYYAILITFLILLSNCTGKPTESSSHAPKPCCLPKQHSSQMSMSSATALPDGKSYSTHSVYNFTYDSDRGLVALKGQAVSIPDGKTSNWWIIESMTDGQTFTIDVDAKICYKSIIRERPLYCIPETAVYQYSSTYGYGDHTIIGDTWLIPREGATMYFTVSNDGLCVPLNGVNYYYNPPTVNSTTISNFVPKILDPSAFEIPAECKSVF